MEISQIMSNNKLFVGGLAWATDDNSLQAAFAKHGNVTEAKVIMDRDSGRSRGFGFVTFEDGNDAQAAISQMDGADLDGRAIRVNEANERKGPRNSGGYRNDGGYSSDGGRGGQGSPRRGGGGSDRW